MSKVQPLGVQLVGATDNKHEQYGRVGVMPLIVAILIAAIDLLVWRAAIGAVVFLIACLLWAGFALTGPANGKASRAAQRLGLGVGALILSLALGMVADRLNERAARSLAAKALAYKAERGAYPSAETANAWGSAVLGYTQRYSLTGTEDAQVWFVRFNYRLQSLAVATGQLQEERNQ